MWFLFVVSKMLLRFSFSLNNTEHSISIKFKFTHNKHLKRYSMFALNQKCCFKSHSTNVAYVWFIKIKIKDGKSFCFQWWTRWNKGQEECLQTECLCWCAFYVFCQNWSNKPKNELPIQLNACCGSGLTAVFAEWDRGALEGTTAKLKTAGYPRQYLNTAWLTCYVRSVYLTSRRLNQGCKVLFIH